MGTESPTEAALRNLERLMARDPLLRDLVAPVLPRVRERTRFSPDVDVLENDDSWRVVIEVPGARREDLHIEIDGNRLIVSGTKPTGRSGFRVRTSERGGGAFQREFLLPPEVDPRDVRATLDGGLLTIRLPRMEGEGRRTVEIT